YNVLREITGMNAKKNPEIGNLADNVLVAIAQEKRINQDIHDLKGKVSSNIGKIIEEIINEKPNI
ncbi:MAG: RloB domain-containing protein, partial [Eubacterium sp.]|nr:RloB domain-containing protein [Eubacterium sp.]